VFVDESVRAIRSSGRATAYPEVSAECVPFTLCGSLFNKYALPAHASRPHPIFESRKKRRVSTAETLHCNTVISCFFGKHFGARVEIPETPHPLRTSAPFSPGRRLGIPPPSPRGEGGPPPAFSSAGAGRVRGHFLVAAPSLCALFGILRMASRLLTAGPKIKSGQFRLRKGASGPFLVKVTAARSPG
jgi:hypothetical protein